MSEYLVHNYLTKLAAYGFQNYHDELQHSIAQLESNRHRMSPAAYAEAKRNLAMNVDYARLHSDLANMQNNVAGNDYLGMASEDAFREFAANAKRLRQWGGLTQDEYRSKVAPVMATLSTSESDKLRRIAAKGQAWLDRNHPDDAVHAGKMGALVNTGAKPKDPNQSIYGGISTQRKKQLAQEKANKTRRAQTKKPLLDAPSAQQYPTVPLTSMLPADKPQGEQWLDYDMDDNYRGYKYRVNTDGTITLRSKYQQQRAAQAAKRGKKYTGGITMDNPFIKQKPVQRYNNPSIYN